MLAKFEKFIASTEGGMSDERFNIYNNQVREEILKQGTNLFKMYNSLTDSEAKCSKL